MTNIGDLVAHVLKPGQSFFDDHGRTWRIEDSKNVGAAPTGEYFVVRLSVPGRAVVHQVMTRLEFETLALKARLRLRPPD
jgi:hypothetical protein